MVTLKPRSASATPWAALRLGSRGGWWAAVCDTEGVPVPRCQFLRKCCGPLNLYPFPQQGFMILVFGLILERAKKTEKSKWLIPESSSVVCILIMWLDVVLGV